MARSTRGISIAFAAICAFAAAGAANAKPPAEDDGFAVTELSADRPEFTTSEDVVVRFTVANRGMRAIDVYLPETPFGDVENDLFVVTRDGYRVDYLGIVAKRPAPGPEDFIHIAPGRSRSVDVELTHLYDMSQPGNYTVSYRSNMTGSQPLVAAGRGGDSSNEVNVRLVGDARRSPLEALGKPGGGGGSYPNCSATQITTIDQAKSGALNYATSAANSNFSSSTARFTTWFGGWTSSRGTTAKQHYQSISSAFANQNVVVNCGCKQNYYAYVYPTKPYEIFVCKVFWTAPTTGTDSKAGTLVHEMSHFNVTAGTDDWAYGQSACKSLAISDPAKALDNADSHEYYAENNPPQ